ncbi:MAG: hypothetical protein DMD96_03105 [Candidatus Rokuibacteriota bacterium]|nr:MAG: hypothetical protein DMD96_03105 [Candidatus Rokubacteria bacterium]
MSEIDDSPAARLRAAERYLSAAPIRLLVEDMLNLMERQIPADKASVFARVRRAVPNESLREAFAKGMTKYLSVKELDALTSFASTPEGRSALGKMSSVMSEFNQALVAEMQSALEKTRSEAQPGGTA